MSPVSSGCPASTCGGGHPLVDESERPVSGARVVLAGQDESAALSGGVAGFRIRTLSRRSPVRETILMVLRPS